MKKRISTINLDIDWDDSQLTNKLEQIIDRETAKAAEIAYQTAEKLCPVETGELVNSLRVNKSLFPNGGYIVRVDNPRGDEKGKKDFAIKVNAVEFGHFQYQKDTDGNVTDITGHVPAQPFLRPAIKKVKRIFKKNMQDAIDSSL